MNKEQELKKWIALYTKPRHEKLVQKELGKKGVQTYLPLLKERRRWSDRKKWVEFPMFKSYIFVKTELKNSLFTLQISGVVKIIRFGDKIATLKESNIQAIKLMLEGGYNPKPIEYFIKGDPVEVKDGPLKGLIGEVTQIDRDNHLIIRVDAIQHSISVKIKRGFLTQIKKL